MVNLDIPVGVSDFSEIRKNGYYYVDKTSLICELLKNAATKATLITRPRRFGKTLAMSMLADFFDIRRNSKILFEGLEVAKHRELCDTWMNRWPVIFFSFKDIDGLTFSMAYDQLAAQMSELYKEHAYLLTCEKMDPDDKDIFLAIKAGRATNVQLSRALSTLMRMMQIYYGQQVILLLDEYDVPAAKASAGGYYAQMIELIRVMMSTAMKDNRALRFAVITGCLKIAKESIFTGMNNMISDTITDSHLDEYFGFTQDDVNHILADAEAAESEAVIREWYDGYHFGDFDIYCPWDVMNYLRDLQENPKAEPKGYWKNTSDNAIIRSFIDISGGSITKKLEILLAGGYIIQRIDENLTYDYLHSSEENLWSVLYLTGYLTRIRERDLNQTLPEDTMALAIPNTEIRNIFESTIATWFSDTARTWNRRSLFDAVWSGDCEGITHEMSRLLRKTISYHDYREDFYHAFLAGIFTGAGYMVESNREHGEGRSDIVVQDPSGGQAAVFEVKYSRTMESMENDCKKAAEQIKNRGYAEEYEEEYDHVLCYGIAFFKKRCLVGT